MNRGKSPPSPRPPPQPSACASSGAGPHGLRAFAERHGLTSDQAVRASEKYGEHIERRIAEALHRTPDPDAPEGNRS
ncbi:hypothetical protein GCM10007301_06630 [Azorhizobium oxalatiphilum]|uniref:Uncharacterized protein n=1 Tax=Azorhizobium oxalatiphilum TaxID=980631 RepID=A0A917BMX3_9HYPH|nr:hypothetical protein [Azorhizobium oxalatiphilum]GGF50042.1 hypothetical protein GCM10007301_06630 [Azorhizobium oxalatiphilum]